MNKILSINEFEGIQIDGASDWERFAGWRVVTQDETIFVAISDGLSCCEEWGYFSTDDNPQRFIGADLLSIERVDGIVPETVLKYGLDMGGAMFVNFITSEGKFQLVVYNAHNGNYGHSAVLISRSLIVDEVL